MRKPVKVVLAVVLVGFAAAIARQVFQPREPVYKGKRLSAWLEAYSGLSGVPTREEADEALSSVGTNAIPTLLRLLRREDGVLRTKLMDLADRLDFLKIHWIPADILNMESAIAFQKLGQNAQSSVPALIEIYEEKISVSSQRCTALALSAIGPSARQAVPALLGGTTNSDPQVRSSSLIALTDMHAEPEQTVTALTNALVDPDSRVRLIACTRLGGLADEGISAIKKAVPALLAALNQPGEPLKNEAARVLNKIDPEAAAKAGLKPAPDSARHPPEGLPNPPPKRD